jgi:eukaryotic-like serine/threonine-protein kinase
LAGGIEEMSLTTGTKLGPYEILAPIGAGGMGEVYRARDTKLKRDVALKVLPGAFASDPERMARFQREAEVLASLNHPNIAQIYGVEERALVMELVEGESPKGPMPFEDAWKIASQIAAGLEYAHEKGIVHRDLKPANVKVTPDGVVKILDFGLAKAFSTPAMPSGSPDNSPTITLGATQLGVILGTAAYMAPEQAKGKSVDKRADIWSFGVVLYELLTGERLFDGEDVADTLAQVLTKEPNFEKAPGQARIVLRRCLEKDPRQRLRDIGEARFLAAETPTATAATSRSARFNALGWVTAGALALVATVLVWAPWRTPPAAPELMRFHITIPENQTPGLFALSPGGRHLAFWAAGSDGTTRIWVRAVDSLEARPLVGTERPRITTAPTPFWAPDGRSVAFDSDGKLKRMDIYGGPAQTVCSIPGGTAIGGAWNSDGVIIFGTAGGPLMRVSASGGPPTPITKLDASHKDNRHLLPVFLPDRRHFLYLRVSSVPEYSGIYVGSLDARPQEQSSKLLLATTFATAYVAAPKSHMGYLLFLREGVLMAQSFDERHLELNGEPAIIADHVGVAINGGFFSASRSSVLVYRTGGPVYRDVQLTWLDSQGRAIGKVLEPGPYANPSIARDGTRAAVMRRSYQTATRDLWLIEFARGTGARFTFQTDNLTAADFPVWSPDGSRVAFMSNHDGPFDLYVKAANNAKKEEPLLGSAEPKAPTSWSPDGRFLLYNVDDAKTRNDIWVLPIPSGKGGDEKPAPLLATEFNERNGQFSPDGRWVAYVSDESGRDEIYVREFSAASDRGKWLISSGGGANPHWRGDGKALFYSAPDGSLMVTDIFAGSTLQPSSPKLLFKLPPGSGAWDVTSDGKRFLVPVPAQENATAPFTVVLNWPEVLKQR